MMAYLNANNKKINEIYGKSLWMQIALVDKTLGICFLDNNVKMQFKKGLLF